MMTLSVSSFSTSSCIDRLDFWTVEEITLRGLSVLSGVGTAVRTGSVPRQEIH